MIPIILSHIFADVNLTHKSETAFIQLGNVSSADIRVKQINIENQQKLESLKEVNNFLS